MVKVISTLNNDMLIKRPSVMVIQDIGPAKYEYTFSYRKSAEKAAEKLRAQGAEVVVEVPVTDKVDVVA